MSSASSVAAYVFTAVWDANYDELVGYPSLEERSTLHFRETEPGMSVKEGTKLRILPVGDSITVGFLSDRNGGDGNGYRGRLRDDLSGDEVVYAGTQSSGTMRNGRYAAWSGRTIQYIADHVGPSLEQRPNVILLAAGTNDMNPNPDISTEGNDPVEAARRLGRLVDQMIEACPDATILVAMIINTCDPNQSPRTRQFQQLIPGVVASRRRNGHHVLAADFTSFRTSDLQDCIHPTNQGYRIMGDYWYSFLHQIPESWIEDPIGPDPDEISGDNGGIDGDIPPPDWGRSPIQRTSRETVAEVARWAVGGQDKPRRCNDVPNWRATGQIALGLGNNGDWQYRKNWVAEGEVASGLGWDERYVRLHDMNGDGKADYVWIHPETGEIRCWLNNLPEPWSPAGNNDSIIGSGVGPARTIFLADMNGDGMDDYLVVNGQTGSVRVWWNYGPDNDWVNGWRFVEGGEIASGVPHANLDTLRFPDINGDGRADYVYIGEGGSLRHYMNAGSLGGQDVLFHSMGGIATGAANELAFKMNGDGRDDYLIWDEDGGLTGFLTQPTNREGVPLYVNQGPDKTIADGIGRHPDTIRLADMDGDGRDDYVHVGDNGQLSVWYNRGTTEDTLAIDGIRFADIDGDGRDDYIWLHPETGAPTVFLNAGIDDEDSLGWAWRPLNSGRPIASGAAPASQVVFGDIDGDGLDDYLDLDPRTGLLRAYLNLGEDEDFEEYGWRFEPIGTIASGLGPGGRVRIADIDGDGVCLRDDYIFLRENGGTTIYRNIYTILNTGNKYEPMPRADASGIGQHPDEIDFVDIDGDGKADYVWTRKLDGRVMVWYNQYPDLPAWREGGEIAGGVGTSGANIRYANLLSTGRADYVPINPNNGAIGAWVSGCRDIDTSRKLYKFSLMWEQENEEGTEPGWAAQYHPEGEDLDDMCYLSASAFTVGPNGPSGSPYPQHLLVDQEVVFDRVWDCFYNGGFDRVGNLICEGVSGIHCYRESAFNEEEDCEYRIVRRRFYCEW
ncbi:hypothetical protein B0I35DRAFT_498648 [Stachybotrys elegans]|uniref:SGNH hydrolase-type esterase domain-containing protein n=1 Tax=Stachybotrys elegans TaxID=80388 RepID=A0A8K0SBB3_9HYPO|nr:hypothetical protein B0I35DRAFT_498648 [Stachybotrys elegans]